MLAPKKVPNKKVYNKYAKKRYGTLKRGSLVSFGEIGLMATTSSWVTSRQIEAARKVIAKRCKIGKIYIRIFPSRPVTAKGQNTPMGSGVGGIDYFMFPVHPGRILFEVKGVDENILKEAFRIASHKLPIKTKIVNKEETFI